MKIRILCDGRYSNFDVPGCPGKAGAMTLTVGDEVDYPVWYAESIVGSGLAELVIEAVYWDEEEAARLASKAIKVPSIFSVDATNAARELAMELGLNLSHVTGSGKGGRITLGDVRKAAR